MTGGFRLGAEWAGIKFDKKYHSDIDDYANKVYAKHFPDSIQLGDITEVDFEKLKDGNEWIITGGFPCQDISIAGKGAGIEGSRSGLWSEMFRAIRVLRPRFAIIENVSAITFRGLDRVLADLAEIGYNAEWQNIQASDMGAPHRRERIWIVAYPRLSEPQRWEYPTEGLQHRERGQTWSESSSCGDVAYSMQSGLQTERPEQQTAGITRNSTKISNTLRIGGKTGISRQKQEKKGESGELNNYNLQRKHEDLQGWWSIEPYVGMLVNGLSSDLDRFKGRLTDDKYERTNQLKCLGNSIVPQIAQLLFEQIKEYL